MEYRRTEVRKILRHREFVNDDKEIKAILEKLKERNIRFSMKATNIGPQLMACTVLSVDTDSFCVFSNSPKKIQTVVKFKEIELIDFESNAELMIEDDDGGRWARLMS